MAASGEFEITQGWARVSNGSSIGETWAYMWLGSVVEAALLLLIAMYAWTWPRAADWLGDSLVLQPR